METSVGANCEKCHQLRQEMEKAVAHVYGAKVVLAAASVPAPLVHLLTGVDCRILTLTSYNGQLSISTSRSQQG